MDTYTLEPNCFPHRVHRGSRSQAGRVDLMVRFEATTRPTSHKSRVGFHGEITNDWAHRLEHAAFEIDLGAPRYISSWNTRAGLDLLKVSRDPIEFEGVRAMIHLRGPAANMRQRTYGPSNGRGE